MNRKIWKYLKLAGDFALSRNDRRIYKLGCVAVRSDGALVKARNGPTITPEPFIHAEARISTKIDHEASVFVARAREDGTFAMAKPCALCMMFLMSKRVKRVYYTTGPDTYECIAPLRNGRHITMCDLPGQ